MFTSGAVDSKAPVTVNCSSHWFDARSGVAAVGWYEQGVRFLDYRTPTDIKQVGYYIPANGSTWAAYWSPTDPTGQIVYTADAYRGIDVLQDRRRWADRQEGRGAGAGLVVRHPDAGLGDVRAAPGVRVRLPGAEDLAPSGARDCVRDQLELPRLVAQRPQVDALAAGLGVAREELGAVLRGTDADLRAKLVGISPQERGQDVGEHAIALRPILRHPGPHRRERVGEAVRVPARVLERACQRGAGGGEALRRRVVGGGEPAVTRPRDASEARRSSPSFRSTAGCPAGPARARRRTDG